MRDGSYTALAAAHTRLYRLTYFILSAWAHTHTHTHTHFPCSVLVDPLLPEALTSWFTKYHVKLTVTPPKKKPGSVG